jgi:hypothetical protein
MVKLGVDGGSGRLVAMLQRERVRLARVARVVDGVWTSLEVWETPLGGLDVVAKPFGADAGQELSIHVNPGDVSALATTTPTPAERAALTSGDAARVAHALLDRVVLRRTRGLAGVVDLGGRVEDDDEDGSGRARTEADVIQAPSVADIALWLDHDGRDGGEQRRTGEDDNRKSEEFVIPSSVTVVMRQEWVVDPLLRVAAQLLGGSASGGAAAELLAVLRPSSRAGPAMVRRLVRVRDLEDAASERTSEASVAIATAREAWSPTRSPTLSLRRVGEGGRPFASWVQRLGGAWRVVRVFRANGGDVAVTVYAPDAQRTDPVRLSPREQRCLFPGVAVDPPPSRAPRARGPLRAGR